MGYMCPLMILKMLPCMRPGENRASMGNLCPLLVLTILNGKRKTLLVDSMMYFHGSHIGDRGTPGGGCGTGEVPDEPHYISVAVTGQHGLPLPSHDPHNASMHVEILVVDGRFN